jgi:type III restriction enzyme
MNRHVNAIAGRLSLRPPQRQSLEILDRVTEIAPPKKGADVAAALAAIQSEFPGVTNFEREFPSLCFALATGVGKTRLMGAFISYLHLAHGIDNFFVLAPNLTIYDKLITDFTPNTPKYVFKGIAEFATDAPEIITGDNYDQRDPTTGRLFGNVRINIFNISKINSEVRGGKQPRIKRLREYIGESYFDYLAALPDLVMLMDESHRYRASAGIRTINELKPILGLELTATPFVEAAGKAVAFQNIVLDYPLGQAMDDGFVKEPAVVTRKNFNPAGMSAEAIERLKLEDGIRLHEQTKVELETYARESGQPIVKPFVLVIARDTTHAASLKTLIESDEFFEGRYRDRVIQIDSSASGSEKDENVERLLRVERSDEPTEIVIHVNMLKEGWDVTNLYTIVPLRAANARVLIEQSIGRGLRLPYGKRTGVEAVDRLSIVAHDRFQEIIDEANKPGSPIRLKSIVLDPDELAKPTKTVISPPNLESKLGIRPAHVTGKAEVAGSDQIPAFENLDDQRAAQLALDAIRKLSPQPNRVAGLTQIRSPEIQAQLVREVAKQWDSAQQLEMDVVKPKPDFAAIVTKTSDLVVRELIGIPRISVLPKGEVKAGFRPFDLQLDGLRYQAPAEELWVQYLRTGKANVISLGDGGIEEKRLEDYVVSGLVDFNDVAYDEHADLLYGLASQVVAHLRSYLSEEEAQRVLGLHQKEIARFVHAQMQDHYWEEAVEYEVVVSHGFTELKSSAYSTADPTLDFRQAPADKSNMAKYLFGGFARCLYPVEKFQSDTERMLAVILDREAEKWFKPTKGQFQIFYRVGADPAEYQPDFVAETKDAIYMLEPKARNQMTDVEVLAKREAALLWCQRAGDHAATCSGKPWIYALIPHDIVADNKTIAGLVTEAARQA